MVVVRVPVLLQVEGVDTQVVHQAATTPEPVAEVAVPIIRERTKLILPERMPGMEK